MLAFELGLNVLKLNMYQLFLNKLNLKVIWWYSIKFAEILAWKFKPNPTMQITLNANVISQHYLLVFWILTLLTILLLLAPRGKIWINPTDKKALTFVLDVRFKFDGDNFKIEDICLRECQTE